jgi:arylsulfatase A-like enzyme
VEFRVTGRRGEGPAEELFAAEIALGPDAGSWHWHAAEVDLARFAGGRLRLTLSTRAPASSRGYALWGHPVIDAPRAAGDPPNVIWIAVDTLRADRLSSYGHSDSTSPHLDALAADGIRFHDAISTAHWTRPAFASLFTGKTPARHGVLRPLLPLAAEHTTLAERFRAGGWITHAVLYKPYLYADGHDQGFDSWFNVPQIATFAEQNLRKALIWLQRNGDRRFFLFLHFDDPHQPLTQPPAFIAAADRTEMRALGLRLPVQVEDDHVALRDARSGSVVRCERCAAETARFRRLARRLYDDEVSFVDDRIGALIAYLKQRGLYDDALIAFVSDHGETLWDHDEIYGHSGEAGLYDELIRVPLILKPPAGLGLPRGAVVRTQVRAFDLMPTLLELAGLAPEEGLDARSLVPLLRDGDGAEAEGRVAFSQSKRGAVAVRHAGFKFVSELSPPRERLFDLGADPGERNDVAAAHPEVVAAMRRRAAAYRGQQGPTLPAAEPADVDAQKVEALRALGYLE